MLTKEKFIEKLQEKLPNVKITLGRGDRFLSNGKIVKGIIMEDYLLKNHGTITVDNHIEALAEEIIAQKLHCGHSNKTEIVFVGVDLQFGPTYGNKCNVCGSEFRYSKIK